VRIGRGRICLSGVWKGKMVAVAIYMECSSRTLHCYMECIVTDDACIDLFLECSVRDTALLYAMQCP